MDLQITVFLLFVLFTAGHSIRCYQCAGVGSCDPTTCPAELTNCIATTIDFVNSNRLQLKSCAAPAACATGSINYGTQKVSNYCCKTDLCNAQDPEPPTTPNGKSCFYCDDVNCLKTVSCSGNEDRCIKVTGTSEDQQQVVKGCASKSICDATASFPSVLNVSCCKGNLCNSAQSVTQSFLFLCGSLISYFLLH